MCLAKLDSLSRLDRKLNQPHGPKIKEMNILVNYWVRVKTSMLTRSNTIDCFCHETCSLYQAI